MKTIKKLSIVIIIFCALSCSNDNSSNEDETKATIKDIYVCGYEKKSNGAKLIAVIWKNGVATSLTDGTRNANANDVAVVGNDVYAVGYEENNNGVKLAKVWKNGISTNLTDGSTSSNADLIEVSGADVYIKGDVTENGKTKTKLWKNGTELFTLTGLISAIEVSNKDIYAVGSEGNNAKIWKNGVGTNLTNGNVHSSAFDIDIQGNDVYVAGIELSGYISVCKILEKWSCF